MNSMIYSILTAWCSAVIQMISLRPEDWNNYESYWMFVDGIKVGCTAFQHDV